MSELDYTQEDMTFITGLMPNDIKAELLNVNDNIRIKAKKICI